MTCRERQGSGDILDVWGARDTFGDCFRLCGGTAGGWIDRER